MKALVADLGWILVVIKVVSLTREGGVKVKEGAVFPLALWKGRHGWCIKVLRSEDVVEESVQTMDGTPT